MKKSPNSVRRKTAHMIRLLMDGMHSLSDIAEKTGMDYETVRPFVKELHAAGVVHIAGYRKRVKVAKPSALYAFGVGIDAPYPQAKSGTKRTREWRQRVAELPLSKPPMKVCAPSSVFDLGRHLGVGQ